MDFYTARRILFEYINEFYLLEKGAVIFEPDKPFIFNNVILRRRAIKHVIEQRKAERISPNEMKRLFTRILKTIDRFDMEIININQSDYPMSIMQTKIFPESEIGIVVVLDKHNDVGHRTFITAFYCRPERIVLMQKKKPQ